MNKRKNLTTQEIQELVEERAAMDKQRRQRRACEMAVKILRRMARGYFTIMPDGDIKVNAGLMRADMQLAHILKAEMGVHGYQLINADFGFSWFASLYLRPTPELLALLNLTHTAKESDADDHAAG